MGPSSRSFLVGGRLSRRLMGAFILIIAILAVVVLVVGGGITAESLEARAQSQLRSDEAIVTLQFRELEDNLVFMNEMLASSQMLTEEIALPTASRSLVISLLSDLRHRGMTVHLFKGELPPGEPYAALVQKGFLGIRTLGLAGFASDRGWEAWLVSVAPIETKTRVEQVVSVSFPLTPTFLKGIAGRIGSGVTLLLPNGRTLSTLPAAAVDALLRQIQERGVAAEKVGEPLVLSTSSAGEPSKSLVSPFMINFRREGLLVLTMPMADLLAAKWRIVSKGLLTTLTILFGAGVLYLSLIRRITKPLGELSAATRDIARGNLDLSVNVSSGDEIGDLAASFNGMIERLRESREEIERWNRTLEGRVEERTHSLEAAKSELKAANDQLVQALEELRGTQAKMIRTEKLAALGQMASAVAHEVQNPLAGMRGALEVLLREQAGGERAEVMKLVLEQVDRLSRTTTRLLSFARPAVPSQAPADLANVIEKVQLLLQEQAKGKGVGIVTRLEPLDRLFWLDSQLTIQAFLNIALNAVQAMGRGGTLTIASRWERETGELVVAFEDTGEGMPPEVREKIFTPFFTTKHHGTGLGLYVVKDIIEQQGGSVEVASTPGRGTVFTVRLPAREEHPSGRADVGAESER